MGSIIPPTVLMLAVVALLQLVRGEAWVSNFVRGLAPAVSVLMVLVAWQVFHGELTGQLLLTGLIAVGSLAALLLNAPAPLVLLAAGLAGIVFFR
jgi:chromate transport protein ChrA